MMGATTGISWADASWNPWQGCQKVSSGCANCYMFREKTRYGQDPSVVVRSKPATFNAPLKWDAGKRVFVCSWSDFFHPDADPWRADAWSIMRQRTDLTFLILTKRIDRAMKCIPWGEGIAPPWKYIHLGVSVEDQATADARIPLLLQTPAAVHWVSYEPSLGPLHIYPQWWPHNCRQQECEEYGESGVDWLVCGGESGPQARPCDLEWIRSVVAQCKAAGVSCFVKQLGANPINSGASWRGYPAAFKFHHRSGADPSEWPEDLRVREFPA